MVGTVKSFDLLKGYGFIEQEHAEDIFVHYKQILDFEEAVVYYCRGPHVELELDAEAKLSLSFAKLRAGQRVSFDVVWTPKGIRAVNVIPI